MKYLIDSHVWIWLLKYPERIPSTAMSLLQQPQADLYFSVGSVWELALKRARKKAEIPVDLLTPLKANNVQLLPITIEHAEASACLPFHHNDPFDRLFLAQAMLEDMTLVTHDKQFIPYNVPLVKL